MGVILFLIWSDAFIIKPEDLMLHVSMLVCVT